ncbi:hypothetical protein CesoFtcFv8_016857 [Champsocephalus esox]|uniref:Uncharacterized protein n=1 Tax=Champsocephalus esox TaxID=159716 RepID=A0AAN8BIC4_9TELE|nr:hypothetical protein CesoFtcFv8_016857 [Champsocephalus esox]
MMDGAYRENHLGPGEQEHRESGPGDRRTPPDADPRMGAPPPGGRPMGPMDGPFPRRAPYGPPHPDFYPPQGTSHDAYVGPSHSRDVPSSFPSRSWTPSSSLRSVPSTRRAPHIPQWVFPLLSSPPHTASPHSSTPPSPEDAI